MIDLKRSSLDNYNEYLKLEIEMSLRKLYPERSITITVGESLFICFWDSEDFYTVRDRLRPNPKYVTRQFKQLIEDYQARAVLNSL